MTPEETQRLKAAITEIASILYKNTSPEALENLEGIEKTVRTQMLSSVSPQIAFFLSNKQQAQIKDDLDKSRICVGELSITEKQAQKLGLEPRTHLSPVLEKCSLRLCANESYQNAEEELEALTGMKVGHSTLHRLVIRQDLQLPEALQAIPEVSLDGGKVRLRTPKGQECEWRDYKAVRLGGIYYGAFFGDHQALLDWVNSQRLINPLVCLGDGHDGVWKLFAEIGNSSSRLEILDWYHLRENLHKVGGSLKRLKQAEDFLWTGQVNATIALFADLNKKQAKNFCAYLNKHRNRIVNYAYYQAKQLCSIGSGAVESAIKQIGMRLKLSGSQWHPETGRTHGISKTLDG
ncbi:ISKra4 family transposase [Nostoc flagelliforme]|nr:ISKra4 family transposase [Nostoc flagelliforme]